MPEKLNESGTSLVAQGTSFNGTPVRNTGGEEGLKPHGVVYPMYCSTH